MVNVNENKDYTIDRSIGFQTSLADAGLEASPALYRTAENSIKGGREAVRELLANRKNAPFSAIFCASDMLGLGAMTELHAQGLSVPEDVSLIGYDGLGYELMAEPHLTTIHQPVFEIGKMLGEALVSRVQGRTTKIENLIKPEWLEGGSVGECPKK
jgi:LacI family transcriptional regulator